MHASRSSKTSHKGPLPPIGSTLSVPHGSEYLSLLNIPDFKAALIDYLTTQFISMAKKQTISIVIDSPSLHNPQCISKHRIIQLPKNQQGEADYTLWHHAINCTGIDILVVSGDTDVWVYGLGLWEAGWLINKNGIVKKGLSGEYVNINLGARSIKDCAQLQQATNPIAAIVGLYVMTGCDYVSSFFKQAKEKFIKCLLKHADYIFEHDSSMLKFLTDASGHQVFDYIQEEPYLRLICSVYLEKHSSIYRTQTLPVYTKTTGSPYVARTYILMSRARLYYTYGR